MTRPEEIFARACAAVISAGELFNDRALAGEMSLKGENDFVTEVDTAVQKRLKGALHDIAPDIQLLGEERDNSDIDMSRPVWILDPVDGTSNLMHDFRYSAVSLALFDGREVVFGCVYNPFSDELFSAQKGKGAQLNGRPIRVKPEGELKRCNISAGAAPGDRANSKKVFDIMRRVYDSCHDIRRLGSAALELCYVAAGRQDGYYEFKLKPWDIAAGVLIVNEAGGLALSPEGTPVTLNGPGDVIAANPCIWQKLADIINKRT
ncbi:MAG: inositol monophosphatase family protein [Oscillospiraceae bacterium]